MKRRSNHRLTRDDVYLTDLAVVISTNFYFTIRYRKSINLCLRKPFEVNFNFFYCQCFVAFIIASKQVRDPLSLILL